jgi:hypothetical protein
LITASSRPATNHGFVLFPLQTLLVLGSGAGWILATGNGLKLGQGNPANAVTAVYFSNSRPMIDSTYQKAGVPLNWLLQTSLLPDSGDMFENAMVETAAALALAPSGTASVSFLDELGVQLDAVTVAGFAPDEDGTQLPVVPAAAAQLPPLLFNEGSLVVAGLREEFAPDGTASIAFLDDRGAPLDIVAVGAFAVANGTTPVAGAILAQRQLDWHISLVFKQGSLVVQGLADANTAIGNLYLRYQRSGYMLIDPARLSTGLPGVPNFAA